MKKFIMFAGILAVVVGGTVASAQYFSTAQKNALINADVTSNVQVSAIDGIYKACQDLINATPKALVYAWGCSAGEAKCYNTHNSQNPSDWDVVGNEANCNAQIKPSCSTSAGSSTVVRPEFDPVSPGFGTVTLRRGSAGIEVLNLQKFLQSEGYISIVADGSFGIGTEGAVKHWQKRIGLTADGVFGPNARAAASVGTTTTPSGNRPLWCQGTWNCDTSGWTCIANTAANCNVYCVPDPQTQACNAGGLR